MIQINKRNIGKCIFLSIITLGIYGIYWMYLLVKNTHSIQKETVDCVGEMLCLMFVPFYSLYWWYTRGEKVKQAFVQNNCTSTGNGVVYLIFSIFGLSIISMAIMQNDFNSLINPEILSKLRGKSVLIPVLLAFSVTLSIACLSPICSNIERGNSYRELKKAAYANYLLTGKNYYGSDYKYNYQLVNDFYYFFKYNVRICIWDYPYYVYHKYGCKYLEEKSSWSFLHKDGVIWDGYGNVISKPCYYCCE